jgi:hypothetical protein
MNLPTPDKTWHMVVDFCVFLRKDIKLVYRSLKHQIGLYVFISTDSVYEASDERVREWYIERQKCKTCNPDKPKPKKKVRKWDWGNNIKQFAKSKRKKEVHNKGRVFKPKKRGKNADTDAFDAD